MKIMIVKSIMNHCLTHTHMFTWILCCKWLTSMKNTVPHVRCSYQPKHALENTSGYSYHEKWDMIFIFWLRNIVHNIYNKKLPLLTFIYILHKVIRRESYIYQSTDTIYLSVCVFLSFLARATNSVAQEGRGVSLSPLHLLERKGFFIL